MRKSGAHQMNQRREGHQHRIARGENDDSPSNSNGTVNNHCKQRVPDAGGRKTVHISYCAVVALPAGMTSSFSPGLPRAGYSTYLPSRHIGIVGPNETFRPSTREQYRLIQTTLDEPPTVGMYDGIGI